MASEAEDAPAGDRTGLEGSEDSTLSRLASMQKELHDLSDNAQQLLTEKLFLENECSQLKKRVNRLDEELRNLRSPPFVIGTVQDRIGDNAVVRSSNHRSLRALGGQGMILTRLHLEVVYKHQ